MPLKHNSDKQIIDMGYAQKTAGAQLDSRRHKFGAVGLNVDSTEGEKGRRSPFQSYNTSITPPVVQIVNKLNAAEQ